MDETLIKIVELVAYLVVLFLAAKIKETGFEQLVSKPMVEKFLKGVKPYQPALVVAIGVGLGYLFKLDLTSAINAVVEFTKVDGSTAHALTGAVLGILTMYVHEQRKKSAYEQLVR